MTQADPSLAAPLELGALDADVVRRTAHLARLELQPDEAERFLTDLERILGDFKDLQGIDTTGLPPMVHPTDAAMPLREDNVRPGVDPQSMLDQAPRAEGGLFLVPRVVG
ncbi:MAG: Asp-tRNA(Asn)/Glu-tRNA(Gln) amidotransferase subunit GatC [Myxococcota bacterium]